MMGSPAEWNKSSSDIDGSPPVAAREFCTAAALAPVASLKLEDRSALASFHA
jgi:hypothetical protein